MNGWKDCRFPFTWRMGYRGRVQFILFRLFAIIETENLYENYNVRLYPKEIKKEGIADLGLRYSFCAAFGSSSANWIP